MTEYKGGCATAGAVFGFFGFLMLIGALVVFGGRIAEGIQTAKANAEQARADREWERTQQAQLAVDLANVDLERKQAELDAQIQTLQINNENIQDKMVLRQTLLDHNLAILLALSDQDPEISAWLRAQLVPEPEPEPEPKSGLEISPEIMVVAWGALLMVAGLGFLGLVLMVWRRRLV